MIKLTLGEYTQWHDAYYWCREQFGPAEENSNDSDIKLSSEGRWVYDEFGPMFYFNDEKDAMLFALKWS